MPLPYSSFGEVCPPTKSPLKFLTETHQNYPPIIRRPMGFWGFGVLGSTHVVEQLSFSMFLSILIFDFYLIWSNFFSFGGPNGLILGLG